MNLSVNKLSNYNVMAQKNLQANKINQRPFLNSTGDAYTPSFKGTISANNIFSTKTLKRTGLALLAAASTLLGSCKPEEPPVVIVPEPEPQEVSQEDLDFAANARARLESDPALLQSCLEYMYEHSMFYGAEDLLNGNYPVEWKINVAMACITGDPDMKAWFSGQLG